MLKCHLRESLRLRVLNIPEPPTVAENSKVRVAVLFSGGLDCTVLARMAHDLLPGDQQIDLINVAFENPRVVLAARSQHKLPSAKKRRGGVPPSQDSNDGVKNQLDISTNNSMEISPFEMCPDRETGRKAFQELIRVCPTRCWRFVAVCDLFPYQSTS